MKAFLFVVVLVILGLTSGEEVCANGRRCSEGTTCCNVGGRIQCCHSTLANTGMTKAPHCGLSPNSCGNRTRAAMSMSVDCENGGSCPMNRPVCCMDRSCCPESSPICCYNRRTCCPSNYPVCCSYGCCFSSYPICCSGRCCKAIPAKDSVIVA